MTPHINDVRQSLLDTLKDLRNRETPMDVERARAVAQVASVLVDTAKVEVDFLRATDSTASAFLTPQKTETTETRLIEVEHPFPGIPRAVQHRCLD